MNDHALTDHGERAVSADGYLLSACTPTTSSRRTRRTDGADTHSSLPSTASRRQRGKRIERSSLARRQALVVAMLAVSRRAGATSRWLRPATPGPSAEGAHRVNRLRRTRQTDFRATSARSHQIDVTQRRSRRAVDHLGRTDRGSAWPRHRDHHDAWTPQRRRHSFGLVQRVSGIGGGKRGTLARAPRRPHQHLAHRRGWSLPAVERPRSHRQHRPLGRDDRRLVSRSACRRIRRPADHRHHQGSRHPPRDRRRDREGTLGTRQRDVAPQRCRTCDEGRSRTGVVPARRRQAIRL
ncbi:Uncharacterised protein [Mycobacteroides abscessus subsp. abscessus]|nr:Uncharacterised protein [Mycobacteroides abscessus subsp. abscessus]